MWQVSHVQENSGSGSRFLLLSCTNDFASGAQSHLLTADASVSSQKLQPSALRKPSLLSMRRGRMEACCGTSAAAVKVREIRSGLGDVICPIF